MKRDDLTANLARSLLDYCPDTGVFIWKHRTGDEHGDRVFNRRFAGKRAGCLDGRSHYRYIRMRGWGIYSEHRLAWLIERGEWPREEIDHADGNAANNRIANLREASRGENGSNRGVQKNSRSGRKGVYWCPDRGLWAAEIRVAGTRKHLGRFPTMDQAAAAYATAAAALHGEFARVA